MTGKKASASAGKMVRAMICITACGLLILFLKPSDMLSVEAIRFIGCFVGFIFWLILDITPTFLSGLIWTIALVILRVTDFNTVFYFFRSDTYFLVLSVIAFGIALERCGILDRVAMHIVKMFPKNYAGQVIGLTITSSLINPMIPSVAAKISVMFAFVASMCEKLGFEKKSKEASGLFGSIFMSLVCGCNAFYTGSVWVSIMLGYLTEKVRAAFTFGLWFKAACVWWITLNVLSVIVILVLYKPKDKFEVPADFVDNQLKKMGPMSKQERQMALVFLCAFLLWITEGIHGINPAIVSLAAFSVCFLLGTLNAADFSIFPWTFLMFLGFVNGFASLVRSLGIDMWLNPYIIPFLAPVCSNIYFLIPVLCIVIYIMRYIITANIAVITIMFSVVAPLASLSGISSWVIIFISLAASRVWPFSFSNADEMTAIASSRDYINHASLLPLNYVYMVINIIGFMLSVPLWKAIGLVV